MLSLSIDPEKIKHKNTKYLRGIGIDVIDHLPFIDLNSFRDKKDIAKRCLVMAALLQLHFDAPNDFIENWLVENNLIQYLSPNEKHILSTKHNELKDQEQSDLYWTIEGIWALAWVGKKHDNLSFNTEVENSLSNMLPSFEKNESGIGFIDEFNIRSEKEIFTKLDQFYRAHWFARNNNLNENPNSIVNIDIIMERRKALEWACNNKEEWDEISLDT